MEPCTYIFKHFSLFLFIFMRHLDLLPIAPFLAAALHLTAAYISLGTGRFLFPGSSPPFVSGKLPIIRFREAPHHYNLGFPFFHRRIAIWHCLRSELGRHLIAL